jgi:Protein of unknown function (DUF2950)
MNRHAFVKREHKMLCGSRLRTLRGTALLMCWFLGSVAVSTGQTPQTYSSPEDAMKDLLAAAQSKDRAALSRIFGPDGRRLLSGDSVQEARELESFALRSREKAEVVKDSETQYSLEIGNEGWPFPVPLVKSGEQWAFDTEKGVDELLKRRIGRNELASILVCAAYAVAQWDYFLDDDWNNDGVQEFAQKFISSIGKKDGLYWPTGSGEDPSPLGPLVGYARAEGYSARRDAAGNVNSTPYHGYYLKVLKAQGPNAAGGQYNYMINGRMIAGFALVAYPATYGSSGVMTFIVNQQGRVYQKNLGPSTAKIAMALTAFNPDSTWEAVDYETALRSPD